MTVNMNAISTTAAMMPERKQAPSTPLNNEQLSIVESTLANFDAENLSASDASEIVSIFSEAGIQPGRELENTLKEFGFDAHEIGSLAAPNETNQGSNQANSSSTSGINQSNLQLLQSILEKYEDLSDLNSQDQAQLSKDLFESGLLEPGALINTHS